MHEKRSLPRWRRSPWAHLLPFLLVLLAALVLPGCQANPAAEEFAEHVMDYRAAIIVTNPNLTTAHKTSLLVLLAEASGMNDVDIAVWVRNEMKGESQ